jgi:crotonobetainyl-CoA:carnitine CoA-transferase CaiB-like acyl-CoA transferase
MLGLPLRFDRTPAAIRIPPPDLGADSAEVLAEVGVGPEELGRLRAAGVV